VRIRPSGKNRYGSSLPSPFSEGPMLAQNEHVRVATIEQKATILRLTAHSAQSKSGLTFGGASVDPNGDWAPRMAEPVTLKSDRFVVEVPAASAAVVQIHTG
jgi:Glycosyl hydrolase family 79 C-terminal beta domain